MTSARRKRKCLYWSPVNGGYRCRRVMGHLGIHHHRSAFASAIGEVVRVEIMWTRLREPKVKRDTDGASNG